MRKQIYISSGAFGRIPLQELLKRCDQNGVQMIELSSGACYEPELESLLKEANQSGKQLLIHNYFPVPKTPFVLNLASNDQETLNLSRAHCRKAVDLCQHVGSPFYSVHMGFCFHASAEHLGRRQTELPRILKAEAETIFVESVQELAAYGSERAVDILLENNVQTKENLISGKNQLYLGVEAEESLHILEQLDRRVGLLVDVGHLKVSAQALDFDPEDYLRKVGERVRAVHLSDNDGPSDTNSQFSAESWFWKPLAEFIPDSATYVIEVYDLSDGEIRSQVDLLERSFE